MPQLQYSIPAKPYAMAWLTLLALITGCVQYPMGTTKQQWESLSPAQQAEYQSRQYAVDAERNRLAEAQRQEQARLAGERARAEQERLAAAYQYARYGDIVVVTIQGGMVAFNGKRQAYEPIAFELVRGERKDVKFTRLEHSYETTTIAMKLCDDGNTFYFDEPSRKRIVIANDGWERARTYSGFPVIEGRDGQSEAQGITIRITFKSLPHHRFP